MKHKLLLFSVLCCFLYACEISIEDNKRVYISGRIQDAEGNPLKNIPVSSEVSDYTLGVSETDASGYFGFSSLESYNDHFKILLNTDGSYQFHLNNESKYTASVYENRAEKGNRHRDLYDLGNITLHKKVSFELEINKTSQTNDTLFWFMEIPKAYCYTALYNNTVIEEESQCYESETISNRQTFSDPDFEYSFLSIKGETIYFTYRINQQEQQTTELTLTEDENTFTFEY